MDIGGQPPGSGEFNKEASQARGYCVADNALRRASLAQGRLKALRAARPDPSLRKAGSLGMTTELTHSAPVGLDHGSHPAMLDS